MEVIILEYFKGLLGKNYLVSHYRAFYKYEVLYPVQIMLESIKLYTVIEYYHCGLPISPGINFFFLFHLLSHYYVEKYSSSLFSLTKGLRVFSAEEESS